MKKKILLGVIFAVLFVGLTGCGNTTKEEKNNNNGNTNTNTTKPDHKIYKYMAVRSDSGSNLLYSAYLFDDSFVVYNGDKKYQPCLIMEFDTETGKAKSIKFYTFFSGEEYLNQAKEKFESSSKEAKKNFSNLKTKKLNDELYYLVVDVDPESYACTQFIDSYLVKGQDIEKYKDEVYYSRLYNYDSEPPHEEGDNYFEESLESSRIEWSDNKIEAYEN